MLEALFDDALTRTDTGVTLRIALPWIRSLPLAAVTDVELRIDDEEIVNPAVILGDRRIALTDLSRETGWWFVQDRLPLHVDRVLAAGIHAVQLSFRLAVPYLQVRPDGPLILPFHFARDLVATAPRCAAVVSRDVA